MCQETDATKCKQVMGTVNAFQLVMFTTKSIIGSLKSSLIHLNSAFVQFFKCCVM